MLRDAPIPTSFRPLEQRSRAAEPHSETSPTPPQPAQPNAGSDTTGADPPTPTEKPRGTKPEPAGDERKPKPAPSEAAPTIPLLSPAALPDERDVAESLQSYSEWLVANGGQPLRLQAPPLFPSALAVLKPLEPLLIPRFSHRQRRLDEEHSAECSAELGIVWPVFRPGHQPGLRVRLVLDAGMSMVVWRHHAEELKRVLASSQSFAEVILETLPLEQLDAAVKQERRLTPPFPGSSITLLISDTAGLHWWDRRIQPWLAAVGARQPVVVIHTLPYRYRKSTALREGVSVTLSNQRQLASNSNYRKERVLSPDPWAEEEQHPVIWAPPEGAVIPVISVNPRETRPWAALVMGDRQARCPGVVIPPYALLNSTAPPLPPSLAKPCAEDLLKGFLGVASSEAQMLLSWMAGSPAPLTLGVLRLLQGALRQKGNTAQPLAEVMVSGLLERLPSQEGVRFEEMQFHVIPEVRVLLQKDLDPAAHQTVLHLVTQVLERHWNRRLSGPSFESVVTDPSVDTPQNATGLVHVANLTARMLAELPGKQFQDLAQKFQNKQQDLFRRDTLNNEQEIGSMPANNIYSDMPVSLERIQTGKQKSGRTGQEINEDSGDSRIEDYASASPVSLPTNDQQTIEFDSTIEAILDCFAELVTLIVNPIYSAADGLHTDSLFRDQHYLNALKAFLPLPDDVRIACIQLVEKYQSQPVSPFRERLFPLLVDPIFHQDFVEYLQVG
ncbi:MAG: SAV_2336 N-terminal domain-related protein, partial [Cyanobacteriota bacterium]